MSHDEMVALIRDAIPAQGTAWADLGAGGGNFTRALADLLPPSCTIYAVDAQVERERDERAPNGVLIRWRCGDFMRPLDLPALAGILIANALHFVPHRHQPATLRNMCSHLQPGGRLVIVEYEPDRPLPFAPYPISFARFELLALESGLLDPTRAGVRRSPRSGVAMFAAWATIASVNPPDIHLDNTPDSCII